MLRYRHRHPHSFDSQLAREAWSTGQTRIARRVAFANDRGRVTARGGITGRFLVHFVAVFRQFRWYQGRYLGKDQCGGQFEDGAMSIPFPRAGTRLRQTNPNRA